MIDYIPQFYVDVIIHPWHKLMQFSFSKKILAICVVCGPQTSQSMIFWPYIHSPLKHYLVSSTNFIMRQDLINQITSFGGKIFIDKQSSVGRK